MGQQRPKNSPSPTEPLKADHDIEVTIYTDPLCCWSWAFQPHLEQLQSHFNSRAVWKYRMGGLLPSWNNFHDEVNSVTRPVQMGPVWMHAGQVANIPINHQIWLKDPPSSSYPSCIAVKCAQLQSDALGESFLGLLRHFCMTDGKNIARQSVLFEVANQFAATNSRFDLAKFKDDYGNDAGLEAFRADLEQVRYYNINRFPTLIVKGAKQQSIMISGYRGFPELLKAFEMITPGSEVMK